MHVNVISDAWSSLAADHLLLKSVFLVGWLRRVAFDDGPTTTTTTASVKCPKQTVSAAHDHKIAATARAIIGPASLRVFSRLEWLPRNAYSANQSAGARETLHNINYRQFKRQNRQQHLGDAARPTSPSARARVYSPTYARRLCHITLRINQERSRTPETTRTVCTINATNTQTHSQKPAAHRSCASASRARACQLCSKLTRALSRVDVRN